MIQQIIKVTLLTMHPANFKKQIATAKLNTI